MLLVVGQIIRAHGIHGEVVVDVRTDEPAQRFVAGSALITEPAANRRHVPVGAWQLPPRLTIDTVRPHQGRLLITFDGVHDRSVAEDLRGVRLCVDSADISPPEDPDEFLDHQLIGLAAVNPAGEALGEIIGVDHAPASDLLQLRRPDGRTALVPFVKAIVPHVDIAAGRVVMTPPDGLFDL
jgi:16S rRNA processing protein RimM